MLFLRKDRSRALLRPKLRPLRAIDEPIEVFSRAPAPRNGGTLIVMPLSARLRSEVFEDQDILHLCVGGLW